MTISSNNRQKVTAVNDDHSFFLQKGDPFLDGGYTVGKYNEWRTYYAIKKLFQNASWFKGVRLATPSEDSLGFDIVMNTIYGCIGIQVKSSYKKYTRFVRIHGEGTFIVINIRRYYTSEEVREKVAFTITEEVIQSSLVRNIVFL